MGPFDNDPKFQQLKKVRASGYRGPVDQDGDKAKVTGRGQNTRVKKK